MNRSDNVIELSDYKNNKANCKNEDDSFFDMDLLDISKAIQFTNCMPDIVIRESLMRNVDSGESDRTIQEIVAEVYLSNYLELPSDKYSSDHIRKVAKFISGIYDFENTINISGHVIYKKHQKERSIWIDGFNSIKDLL